VSAAGPFCNSIWIDAEYLLWWTKANQLPPLLTVGSPGDARPGALDQSGTSVLYGGSVDNGARSGGRVRGGWWFTDSHSIGIDGSFFILGGNTTTYTTSSSGDKILAVPYFNVNTNQQGTLPLSYPGLQAANYSAAVSNRLWGADTNFRTALWRSDRMQVSLLAGFRYLELKESLETVADLTPGTGTSVGHGPETALDSRFATRNMFYGGQVGADIAYFYRGFSLDLTGKVAVGGTHEAAAIDGGTQVAGLSATPITYPFGLLAQPSNIGLYSRDIIAWLPEGIVTLGYQFTQHFRATVGYTFLYVSRAVRPGNLIDTGVNPTVVQHALADAVPVVGQVRPTFPGLDSDFWAQGLSVGLEFRY
jgi:hypothetical protein